MTSQNRARAQRPFRVECIGGGPAGLYFAILMRRNFPHVSVRVRERNRPDDTFGWGVVFSDETLSNFEAADPQSMAAIRREFAYWGDIDTYVGGDCVRSTGHGFCGMSRRLLLEILHARAVELGAELSFSEEFDCKGPLPEADLVLAADGIHSALRERFAHTFRPTIEWGKARFTWLGTTLPLEAFTFIFQHSEHGLFQVHAYPFQRGAEPLSTFIVECHEDAWRRAGLDRADEDRTVAYFEALFAEHLRGHRLLKNRSIWRSFPTVHNERWHHDNVVLVGDSAHSAHFSVGSGTKLAMEDAIALCEAFGEHGFDDVPRVLAAYEDARRIDVLKIQRAAATSLRWFEECEQYVDQPPLQFTFNLMTRSRRITWDNLALRDPDLIERVRLWYAAEQGAPKDAKGRVPEPMFAPLALRGMRLANRVVVSPMCQYSACDGLVHDWHLVHLGARAVGGAGLVMTEMTDVEPQGRITLGCAGLWSDAHESAWKRIVDFVHGSSGSRIAMQLAHAGRKASCNLPWEGDDPLRDSSAWQAIGPSALPFGPDWPTPRAMDAADLARVRDAFTASAERAARAGFDGLELHMAHGYLLSSFLSPVSNRRADAYGGDLAGRMRYPLEVFDAVRAVWPDERPLWVRLTGSDWLAEGGMTIEDAIEVARALKERGCDLIDVSSGGNTPDSQPDYGRMYQVPFAEQIRREAGLPVMAVGAIQGADHVNTVLAAGRADLCALARPHLVDPHLTLRAAVEYGHDLPDWPRQYLPAKPRPRPPE
ncbi:MAG TPA: FAD-dependent monooxygenase [Planctomycetota bacterium]|nr:FAD-dependent monooxygenase [Planctomycetota bacterium]